MSVLGSNITRIDAYAKVKGEALYPGDFNLPKALVMKVLFSEKVHAIITKIDTVEAAKVPGVVMILTAKDVPNNAYGLGKADQPVLCGPGSNQPFADRVRFIGDQVALVIAESIEAAEEARSLIRVEYQELPILSSISQALHPEAPLIHPETESNVFVHFHIEKGGVASAFESADVIIEGEYRTPVQEHAYLQPEAGVSYLDEEERITVIVGGQWIHEDQEQIAHALNIGLEKIRIIYPAIGGAFGGREDMSVQIILALATMKLAEKGIDRPVKIVWSREESIVGHHKRHYYEFKTRWAAKKNGELLAADVEILTDGGAYVYTSNKVLGNATVMCTGPYKIPNVRVDSRAVFTNNIPGGAFRGFGGPQGAFVAESQMNKLAEAIGMDPVKLRLMNLLGDEDTLSVDTPLPPGISLDKVIASCARNAGWQEKQGGEYRRPTLQKQTGIKRGIGFASGFKNIGFSFGYRENCSATIELHGREKIEKAVLRHAGAEVGQGAHTVFVQMAAHALGLPIELVALVPSDTATSLNSGSVSASRMTYMAGNAIKGAAALALQKWQQEERPAIADYKYFAPETSAFSPDTGKCMPNFAYGYVACAVECAVDMETGKIEITKVYCSDDVGKAVNPMLVEGQIEGALVQAGGYTLSENFIQVEGKVLTDRLSTYLIPTVLDIPEIIHSDILEFGDYEGPWGVKGVGEMPFLVYPPAIIDAVHDATGVWFDEFPLTPERVFNGIKNSLR